MLECIGGRRGRAVDRDVDRLAHLLLAKHHCECVNARYGRHEFEAVRTVAVVAHVHLGGLLHAAGHVGHLDAHLFAIRLDDVACAIVRLEPEVERLPHEALVDAVAAHRARVCVCAAGSDLECRKRRPDRVPLVAHKHEVIPTHAPQLEARLENPIAHLTIIFERRRGLGARITTPLGQRGAGLGGALEARERCALKADGVAGHYADAVVTAWRRSGRERGRRGQRATHKAAGGRLPSRGYPAEERRVVSFGGASRGLKVDRRRRHACRKTFGLGGPARLGQECEHQLARRAHARSNALLVANAHLHLELRATRAHRAEREPLLAVIERLEVALEHERAHAVVRGHKPARGQMRGARQAAQHEGRAGQLVTVGGAMVHAHVVSPDGFACVLDRVRAVTIVTHATADVGRSFISFAPDQHYELLPAARELVAVAVLGEDAEVRLFVLVAEAPPFAHKLTCA